MNLLVDEDGGPEHEDNVWDSAMMADLSTGEVHRHPQYYFIGHFSKFLPPGSAHLRTSVESAPRKRRRPRSDPRAGACDTEEGLLSTAVLRPDNAIATVVLNCGHKQVSFKLQEGKRAAHCTIPPHAIQTYLFQSEGSSPLLPRAQGGQPFVGVNLGGWLLLEEWMWASRMTEKGIRDEHTLVQVHGGNQDPQAVRLMKEHWDSFVTEEDLDRLQRFGVTDVRVPIGWWLVDFDPKDGFVDGGERFLFRLLRWLGKRGMRCLVDLHAVPGAQATRQSFTGKSEKAAFFFKRRANFERGKRAMLKLAHLILSYEAYVETAGVVSGIELVNEPEWQYWNTSPGVRELYETMVPQIRELLPPERYLILLNFMESPRTVGSAWMARMMKEDPKNYANVVYDAHMYHSFGDDNPPGRKWKKEDDSCKTCCRDPALLQPLVEKGVPMVVGEYSLNTGFPGYPEFYLEFLRNQLSLWANTPHMVGSYFWNHRILRNPGGWYKEMSLLELMAPDGPLPPVTQMNLTARCPGKDLSKCPKFIPHKTLWNAKCKWRGNPDLRGSLSREQDQWREASSRIHKGDK